MKNEWVEKIRKIRKVCLSADDEKLKKREIKRNV